MPDRGTYLIGWLAGGAGIILLYSAYKNVTPASVITGRLSGDSARNVLDPSAGQYDTGTPIQGDYAGDNSGDYSKGNTIPASSSAVARAQQLANRTIQPALVPIPTQPRFELDIIAVQGLMKAQASYGGFIPATGTYRSYAEQAAGHAKDPDRFAEPGHSLHEVGLAIDIDTSKVDVNSARLIDAMAKNGWYRVGKSGPMHWSFGVPG